MSDKAKLSVLKELAMAARKRKPGQKGEEGDEMTLPEMDLDKSIDLPEMELKAHKKVDVPMPKKESPPVKLESCPHCGGKLKDEEHPVL